MKLYSKRHAKHGKLVIPEITRYIPSTVNVKTLPSIDVGEFPVADDHPDWSKIYEIDPETVSRATLLKWQGFSKLAIEKIIAEVMQSPDYKTVLAANL
jgi:hypothetical protein